MNRAVIGPNLRLICSPEKNAFHISVAIDGQAITGPRSRVEVGQAQKTFVIDERIYLIYC